MNRAIRRCLLMGLARSEDGGLMSHSLAAGLPELLNGREADVRTTCALMAREGEVLFRELAGADSFHVEVTAVGRDRLQDINEESNLSLDILFILKSAKRGEFEGVNGFYNGSICGDVVQKLADTLVGAEPREVKACLEIMEGRHVRLDKADGGYILRAWIETAGLDALKARSLHPQSRSGGSVTWDHSVQIHNSGGVVNYQSNLRDVVQKIMASECSGKDVLAARFAELERALAQVDESHQEDAESVKDFAQMLAKELTKEAPVPSRIQVSAEGLKNAAGVLRDICPAVISTVHLILAALPS